jgi:predicted  nucleic acid-binding Zn-ribbon protein
MKNKLLEKIEKLQRKIESDEVIYKSQDTRIVELNRDKMYLEKEIKELEEKNKTFEDYNKDLNRQIDKLEEDLEAEKSINSYLSRRILKTYEYGSKYMPNYDFDHTNLQKMLDMLIDKKEDEE